ncbi:pre-mRNA processing RNA-helicase [Serendipita sp. 407]|nr:pre-mRNA processing RNA-helicase [Serendipita sp. 407]
MTPTRELAVQIHRECKPFLKAMNLRAVCAYGGSPIKDQIAELKKGAEIIVCTPGRMIDLLTANSGRVTNLKRVTYLVLDEADRMFDMGFEPQVMKIVNNIRPDRQTVLFSATFPKQMDSLARKILNKPLEITVGGRSVVAPEITQLVEVRSEDSKFNRLLQILGEQTNEDDNARILVFVDRQEHADNLMKDLLKKNYFTATLHGGKDQIDRDQTITDFKNGVITIVIATSVAARGLDVKQLKVVINYDAPNHMEDYVHRAGRTGRAGNKGTCITFITPDQERYSVDIYRALKASNAEAPPELEALANGFLEKVKSGNAKQAGSGFGGKGLDKLDRDREEKDKAQRTVYGEREEGKVEEKVAEAADKESKEDPMTFGDFKVEIRRGPAPDTTKTNTLLLSATARAAKAQQDEKLMQSQLKAMEDEAARQDKNGPDYRKAMAVITKLNVQLRAAKLMSGFGVLDEAAAAARKKDPDATDFHAIIPINDYPQKARWKVTNKETMSALIEATGASVTNKGIYYEAGKEPPMEGPPKLHLLIESNDEFRVEQAVREIKRLLIEASAAAMQAEVRGPNQTAGRYSVL